MFWEIENISYNQLALIDVENKKQLSYKQLLDKVSFIQNKLISDKKQLVFLYADNSFSSVISYLAILRSGHTCCLIDKNLSNELKAGLVERYKPELIISNNYEYYPDYNVFNFDDSFNIYSYCGMDNHYYEISEELAILLSTSGSTGSPKLVKLSYKNLQSNAASIASFLNIDKSEKPITSLPMSYSYGLSIIDSHLMMGATIVLTNQSFVLRDFWKVFNDNECTSFAGVPYSYLLLEKINFQKLYLPTLKTMTQAGGRLSDKLQSKYYGLAKSNGFNFIIMYGQTEATARMSFLPMHNMKDKIGSIGKPIPGGKFSIVKNGIEITDENVEGEIVYQGDNVMMGYAENRADLSTGDGNHGVLHTGDIGFRDRDGYYYITGRKSRFIKIIGKRYNLDEIEKKIESNFNVPVLCHGEDDHLKIDIESSDETLLSKIQIEVSKIYKISNSIISLKLISKIPLNNFGKPDYAELKLG